MEKHHTDSVTHQIRAKCTFTFHRQSLVTCERRRSGFSQWEFSFQLSCFSSNTNTVDVDLSQLQYSMVALSDTVLRHAHAHSIHFSQFNCVLEVLSHLKKGIFRGTLSCSAHTPTQWRTTCVGTQVELANWFIILTLAQNNHLAHTTWASWDHGITRLKLKSSNIVRPLRMNKMFKVHTGDFVRPAFEYTCSVRRFEWWKKFCLFAAAQLRHPMFVAEPLSLEKWDASRRQLRNSLSLVVFGGPPSLKINFAPPP